MSAATVRQVDVSGPDLRGQAWLWTTTSLAPGEELAVRVYDIPSTGYMWEVTELPVGLERLKEQDDWESENPEAERLGLVGGGVLGNYHFKAEANFMAPAELKLIRHQPWTDESATEVLTVILLAPRS